jgi:hypothetical protein
MRPRGSNEPSAPVLFHVKNGGNAWSGREDSNLRPLPPEHVEDRQDGSDAERAKNLLRRCRNHVGLERWNIFENVVRWNEPTGIPGSRICSLRDEAIWSAQETIAAIAGDIKEIFG